MIGKVYFLGSGTGYRFAYRGKRNTSLLMELPQAGLLVDTGPSFIENFLQLENNFQKLPIVKAVFLTHRHPDHILGFPELLFAQREEDFRKTNEEPYPKRLAVEDLFCPQDVYDILKEVVSKMDPEAAALMGKLRVNILKTSPQTFTIYEGKLTVFVLPHGGVLSWGLRIGDTSYIPDCGEVPKAALRIVAGSKRIILACNSVDKDEPPHFNLLKALAWARQLEGLSTLVLTHLGLDFDLKMNIFHRETAKEPFEVVLSHDFMELKPEEPKPKKPAG